ncbi:MAG: esterase-like activity of phytase family protein, partial [Myxococcota bacterium]
MLRRLLVVTLVVLACARPPPPKELRSGAAVVGERFVLRPTPFLPGGSSGLRVPGGPWGGQPVQGFSGLTLDVDGGLLAVTDNGFGALVNSDDFYPRVFRLEFADGALHTTPLFRFADAQGPLTGAEVDPESLVRAADGTFWVGEEFGPSLLHVDGRGQVLERFWVPEPDGGVLRSPDAPELARLVRTMLAVQRRTGTSIASPNHALLECADTVEQLHKAGFKVVPWTVNEPARMRELISFGVDGLITDRPDLAPRDAGVELQGHRGARGLRPESTLPGFELALELGVDVLELDLTLIADGGAIIWHDAELAAPKCRRPVASSDPATRTTERSRAARPADAKRDAPVERGRGGQLAAAEQGAAVGLGDTVERGRAGRSDAKHDAATGAGDMVERAAPLAGAEHDGTARPGAVVERAARLSDAKCDARVEGGPGAARLGDTVERAARHSDAEHDAPAGAGDTVERAARSSDAKRDSSAERINAARLTGAERGAAAGAGDTVERAARSSDAKRDSSAERINAARLTGAERDAASGPGDTVERGRDASVSRTLVLAAEVSEPTTQSSTDATPRPLRLITATLDEVKQWRCDGLLPERFPAQRRDVGPLTQQFVIGRGLPSAFTPLTLRELLDFLEFRATRMPGRALPRLNVETKGHHPGEVLKLREHLLATVAGTPWESRTTLQSFDLASLGRGPLPTIALVDGAATGLTPQVPRSGGFENLALSADGGVLYAMLEKPLPEDGARELRAYTFDLQQKAFTGVAFRFPLAPRAVAVGDLTMLTATTGLAL